MSNLKLNLNFSRGKSLLEKTAMRARNIKPGFFKNYDLAQIAPPWGRILFEGLWCMADREGRLKDRPEEIRAEIFPYDGDRLPDKIECLLNLLAKGPDPFIARYEVCGGKFIQILHFRLHQSPHPTEKQSNLPGPETTVTSLNPNGELNVNSTNNNVENQPDSLIHLFSDSLNHDSLNHESKKESEICKQIVSMFKETCPNLTQIQQLTDARKKKIAKRLKEHPDLEWWKKVFTKANGVFIQGNNGHNWSPSFDWLMKNEENAVKVIEGNYDKKNPKGFKSGPAVKQWLRGKEP